MLHEIVSHLDTARYRIVKIGGRSLIDFPCCFSPDGQSLFLISRDKVLVYNVATGELSMTLDTESTRTNLISVGCVQDDIHNLYGLTKCSTLVVWTWEAKAILREQKLNIPDDVSILSFNLITSKESFITGVRNKSGDVYLTKNCLETGEILLELPKCKTLTFFKIWSVVIGNQGSTAFAAISNGTHQYYIVNLDNGNIETYANTNNIRVISIAAHPTESCIAIGDALGRATLIKGNFLKNKKLAKEILHWHTLPLLCLAFSLEGNYLFTGGMEKVLVKWAVGAIASKAKDQQFLPRCPGQIRYITTNNQYIAITLCNNSILIVDSQSNVKSTISECGGLSIINRTLGSSLIYHKRLGSLILGARPGHLNLFSTESKKVITSVDITSVNQVPPTRANLIPIDLEVTCAAMNAEGQWLVTSEYRNDTFTYPEERLKFWLAKKIPFKLNTCVVLSHGGCRVNTIVLDNRGEFCITAGTDQKFRVWKVQEEEKKTYWSCLTSCYYDIGSLSSLDQMGLFKENPYIAVDEHNLHYLRDCKKDTQSDIISKLFSKKDDFPSDITYDVGNMSINSAVENDTEIGGVAISQDSSLIAAWFGAKLTIWDASVCNIKTVLSHPLLSPKGVDVKFGNKDTAHYLACTTSQWLAVWNLLSCSIKWLVNINPVCLTADPFTNRMAVVSQNNDVFVFTPHESKPILSKKCATSPREGSLQRCVFGSSGNEEHVRLYFMRNDCEIFALEPTPTAEHTQLEVITKRNALSSNFSALIAEQQTSLVRQQARATEYFNSDKDGRKAFLELFSAPAHTIPPVSILSPFFLEQLAGMTIKDEKQSDAAMKSDDEGSESSSDEDESTTRNRNENGELAVRVFSSTSEQCDSEKMKRILKDKFKWVKLLK